MENKYVLQISFLAAASIVGIVLTVYDKIAAKAARRHRIPEAVLMTAGLLFGAPAMYLTMRLIRHKTRKPKFSVGFPVIILLQIVIAAVLNIWVI